MREVARLHAAFWDNEDLRALSWMPEHDHFFDTDSRSTGRLRAQLRAAHRARRDAARRARRGTARMARGAHRGTARDRDPRRPARRQPAVRDDARRADAVVLLDWQLANRSLAHDRRRAPARRQRAGSRAQGASGRGLRRVARGAGRGRRARLRPRGGARRLPPGGALLPVHPGEGLLPRGRRPGRAHRTACSTRWPSASTPRRSRSTPDACSTDLVRDARGRRRQTADDTVRGASSPARTATSWQARTSVGTNTSAPAMQAE